MSIVPIREFDYNNDRLIVGDIDQREKSYIFVLSNKINELSVAINKLYGELKSLQKEFGINIASAEKKAADRIVNNVQEEVLEDIGENQKGPGGKQPGKPVGVKSNDSKKK